LLIGPEQKKLTGQQCHDAQAQKHVFQIHGWFVFAFSKAVVKHEMIRHVENETGGVVSLYTSARTFFENRLALQRLVIPDPQLNCP
jgi:hypothetical protein